MADDTPSWRLLMDESVRINLDCWQCLLVCGEGRGEATHIVKFEIETCRKRFFMVNLYPALRGHMGRKDGMRGVLCCQLGGKTGANFCDVVWRPSRGNASVCARARLWCIQAKECVRKRVTRYKATRIGALDSILCVRRGEWSCQW